MTNHEILKDLKPSRVWELFAELTQIPRPSNKEEGVRIWLKQFSQTNNLNYKQDEIGNLVIYKEAQNSNSSKTLLFQAHMDMVCQKEESLKFDFEKDPIEVRIEGDYVYAIDTTLGSDNGIGLCMILAILEEKNISHPKIEALFTMNEECGMDGAMGLDRSLISGDFMINLDSEEEGTLWTSSAGGRDISLELKFETQATEPTQKAFELVVTGLRGGHSGINIHENRVNGISLLSNVLNELQKKNEFYLSRIYGGNAKNAIPGNVRAEIVFNQGFDLSIVKAKLGEIKQNFVDLEPDLDIVLTVTELPQKVIHQNGIKQLIRFLSSIHCGVYQMSQSMPNLVQTSFNLGIINTKNGNVFLAGMARSSDDKELNTLLSRLISNVELYLGTDLNFDYENPKNQQIDSSDFVIDLSVTTPGWKHDPNNPLVDIFQEAHQKITGKKADLMAVHAGLECGMLKQYLPDCKIISFGPTIQNAHSPQERVGISSVKDCYEVVLEAVQILGKMYD